MFIEVVKNYVAMSSWKAANGEHECPSSDLSGAPSEFERVFLISFSSLLCCPIYFFKFRFFFLNQTIQTAPPVPVGSVHAVFWLHLNRGADSWEDTSYLDL